MYLKKLIRFYHKTQPPIWKERCSAKSSYHHSIVVQLITIVTIITSIYKQTKCSIITLTTRPPPLTHLFWYIHCPDENKIQILHVNKIVVTIHLNHFRVYAVNICTLFYRYILCCTYVKIINRENCLLITTIFHHLNYFLFN